jgi:hypothetical protein
MRLFVAVGLITHGNEVETPVWFTTQARNPFGGKRSVLALERLGVRLLGNFWVRVPAATAAITFEQAVHGHCLAEAS